MNFKIDSVFENYWPPLPDEKFIILEKSILDEGLRENLIVWKEKGILLDGHQRLRILKKHNLSFDDRITFLSFPNIVHAKHWVHVTQAARRGDAPQFLSICHVMEFEDIYREEAKQRQVRKPAGLSVPRGDEQKGRMAFFMARDSAASHNSVERVLYIRTHDPKRFDDLKTKAMNGEDVAIHLEHSKVRAEQEAKEAGVKIDKEALDQIKSSYMQKAIQGIDELGELRGKYGDDLYFQAVAATPEIRAAFARFNMAARSFQNGGKNEKKEKSADKTNLLNS